MILPTRALQRIGVDTEFFGLADEGDPATHIPLAQEQEEHGRGHRDPNSTTHPTEQPMGEDRPSTCRSRFGRRRVDDRVGVRENLIPVDERIGLKGELVVISFTGLAGAIAQPEPPDLRAGVLGGRWLRKREEFQPRDQDLTADTSSRNRALDDMHRGLGSRTRPIERFNQGLTEAGQVLKPFLANDGRFLGHSNLLYGVCANMGLGLYQIQSLVSSNG